MDAYRFQTDSWRHFLYTAPRFVRSHWWLLLLFVTGYFISRHFSPQVTGNEQWYSLNQVEQLTWYASIVLEVALPLGLTYAVLRFICLDDGVEIHLGPAVVVRFLAAYTLIYLMIGLGTLLLLLPGLLVWTCTLLVPVLILAHKLRLADAFYISYDAVRGHIWKITLGFLPIILAIVVLYLGLNWLFTTLEWTVAVHLLDTLLVPLSVIVSASYTMTLYGLAHYDETLPQGLKVI